MQKPIWGMHQNLPTETDYPVYTLIVMVGLPKSGKTTWALRQGFPVVQYDAIGQTLTGKEFSPVNRQLIINSAQIIVESLFRAGHTTVIMDGTHITELSRARWQHKWWDCRFKVMDTTFEECIRRAEQTNPDLIPVIESMVEKWQDLTRYEVPYLEPRFKTELTKLLTEAETIRMPDPPDSDWPMKVGHIDPNKLDQEGI